MKQTAVEWLKSELTEVERNLINKTFLQLNNSLAGHRLKDIFEQAKEMEKQQQGYNYEKVCEIERFRAINFAKWFADFNGLTWEEKRVSKEHLDNLYEQYLKTLGGTI